MDELEGGFGFITHQLRGVCLELIAFQKETRTQLRDAREDIAQLRRDVGQDIRLP